MISITRRIEATPEQIWEVLADGWLYPLWVVGATRMRAVDDDWPAVGSRLHHSVGVWPLVLDDSTSVEAADPPHCLKLYARGWPLGTAKVRLDLEPVDGSATEVTMTEDAQDGPGRLVPPFLRHPPMGWRNTEALRRLALIVEGRVSQRPGTDPSGHAS